MFSPKVIVEELIYIEDYQEFSDDCPMELRNNILGQGLAKYYEGTLMLTNAGELAIGYTKEQIGMEDEEDASEGFFYSDFDNNDEIF